jgi:hypothetical protein
MRMKGHTYTARIRAGAGAGAETRTCRKTLLSRLKDSGEASTKVAIYPRPFESLGRLLAKVSHRLLFNPHTHQLVYGNSSLHYHTNVVHLFNHR